jgi:hypothetical protein
MCEFLITHVALEGDRALSASHDHTLGLWDLLRGTPFQLPRRIP